MSNKNVLVLNGSPRKKGTSYSFGCTIKQLAENQGNSAKVFHVIDYFDKKVDLDVLLEMISRTDILCLIAPMYVDSLPYPVLWLMEKLHLEYPDALKGKGFFAITQYGFPDVTLAVPTLGSCRIFAEATGMNWLGSLAYGGGAMLDGAKLEELGAKGQKITAGFKLALEEIFLGNPIPVQAQELLTLKIPKILYRPMAAFLNAKAKKTAREHGIDIRTKAY